MTFDPNRMAGDLAPLKGVMIGPSMVTGSPFDYLFVFLTERDFDGPHLIVSDGAEWNEPGVLVGMYDGEGEGIGEVESVADQAAAVDWVVLQVEAAS